ncbi:MAG: hypothetical protein H7263_04980, partial [Candidatus Sericytochromatia bacterium]|nr:hypothetical protein [Candidatus Sericytochromatia bacterium]
MGLLSDQALGKSPFDLPKTYNYESFTDYHINKSEQLLHIKNYDLAIKEFRGLYDCAVNNEILDISSNFKEKFFIAEESLIIRDKFRNKLIDFYRNENISLDYNLAKSYLLGFKDSSKETEEYYQLIEKIISNNLINNEKNINLLEHTYEVILSFDPLKYIIEMGRISLKNGEKPFMLFDLDSTLFDNSPRVHKIIQDFISDH